MAPSRPTRRSARLQALTEKPPRMASGRGNNRPQTVTRPPPPQASPVTPMARGGAPKKRRGRGGKSTATLPSLPPAPTPTVAPAHMAAEAATKKSTVNVAWEGERTIQLITWLSSHPADRHILFHDRLSSAPSPQLLPGDKPSGRNKKDVSAAIARHMFETDLEHAETYAADPQKYANSVTNRLTILKNKYREVRKMLKSTGSGVVPGELDGDHEDPPPTTLLEKIHRTCPHYEELHDMWRGIPALDSDLISSEHNVDHAASLLSIVAPKSGHGVNARSNEAEANEDEDVEMQNEQGDEEEMPGDIDGVDDLPFDANQNSMLDAMNDDYMMDDDDAQLNEPISQMSSMRKQHASTVSVDRGSLSSASKGKTPVRDGRSAFVRHSPYLRSPFSSAMSTSSRKTSLSDSLLAKPTSIRGSRTSTSLTAKVEELDKASEVLETSGTSSRALRMTYALRNKELDLRREELTAQWTHAEDEFTHAHKLRTLDIQLKESEERGFQRQIDLLNKQMEYYRMLKELGALPGPVTGESSGASGQHLRSFPPLNFPFPGSFSSADPGPSSAPPF